MSDDVLYHTVACLLPYYLAPCGDWKLFTSRRNGELVGVGMAVWNQRGHFGVVLAAPGDLGAWVQLMLREVALLLESAA